MTSIKLTLYSLSGFLDVLGKLKLRKYSPTNNTHLYVNGQLMQEGVDFLIVNSHINFNQTIAPGSRVSMQYDILPGRIRIEEHEV